VTRLCRETDTRGMATTIGVEEGEAVAAEGAWG
jgi:hypothetical protein